MLRQSRLAQAIDKMSKVIGILERQIAKAMDTWFDRIESMMFVRTVITDDAGEVQRNKDTGAVVIEDDGC